MKTSPPPPGPKTKPNETVPPFMARTMCMRRVCARVHAANGGSLSSVLGSLRQTEW